MKKIASLLLLLAMTLSVIYAAFEEREISARVLGMSGVSVGIADDIDAVVYNPAELVNMDSIEVQSSVANLYDILNYSFFSFATPFPGVKKFGAFGFSMENFGFQDQYKETKFCFSHGFPVFENFSVGYSIKSLGLKILYDENTRKYTEKTLTSIDVAGFSSISNRVTAGFIFSNLNSPRIISDEVVSMNYKLGFGYRPSEHFNLGVDFEKGNNWRLGLEMKPEKIFVFRSGINFKPMKFSFGIGLNLWKLSFDYGISYHPQLELQHLVTLSFAHRFGEKPRPSAKKEIKLEDVQPAEVEESPEPVPAPTPVPEIVPEIPKGVPKEKLKEIPAGPKVNINTALLEELTALNIPVTVSKNIIRYRRYKGAFKEIDDLRKVPGVTKEIFEAIKDRITVE